MAGPHVARRDLLTADREHKTLVGVCSSVDKPVSRCNERRACSSDDGSIIRRDSGQRQRGRPREDFFFFFEQVFVKATRTKGH